MVASCTDSGVERSSNSAVARRGDSTALSWLLQTCKLCCTAAANAATQQLLVTSVANSFVTVNVIGVKSSVFSTPVHHC